jgi:UDP-N-acetyl-D-glucosamine dehydrogenase
VSQTADSRRRPDGSTPGGGHAQPAQLSAAGETLRQRIATREAVVAVVGLGYVGLPLAAAMHAAGFRVLGFDTDPHKIELLDRGESYLKHLGPELVTRLCADGRFRATADETALGTADAVLLCVPTPLGRHHEPDMSFV